MSQENFNILTCNIWNTMLNMHINPLNMINNTEITKKKLTKYEDYWEKIRECKIKLPEWYLISESGNIFPYYSKGIINNMMIINICNININDYDKNILIFIHMKKMHDKNGMHVSDSITKNIFYIFENIYLLNYLRKISVSPEYVYRINDYETAITEHLCYGLINKKIDTIVFTDYNNYVDVIRKIGLINDIIDPFDKNIKEYWPEIKKIIFIKNKSGITELMGIQVISPVYWITETIIGYSYLYFIKKKNEVDKIILNKYIIDPSKGYFEFGKIDWTNKKIKNVVGTRNLEMNELYMLIVSNSEMNLIRYKTDEIVKFLGYYNASPIIEPVGKIEELIIMSKFIIGPKNIKKIILNIEKKNAINIINYVYKYECNKKIIMYLELSIKSYLFDPDNQNIIYDIRNNIKKMLLHEQIKKEIISIYDMTDIIIELKYIKPNAIDNKKIFCSKLNGETPKEIIENILYVDSI
jgi:hypothetical protein